MSEFWTFVRVYTWGLGVFPWLLGLLLGASLTPLALGVSLVVEKIRERKRRRRCELETCHEAARSRLRNIQASDLRSRLALAGLLLPLAMLIALLVNAYFWAWTILATSTVLCAIWWLRLRSQGVRNAEVYAIALWLIPRIVWAAYVLAYSFLSDGRMYDITATGTADPNGPFAHVFGGTGMIAVALGVTGLIALAALFAASRNIPALKPLPIILLAMPCVVYFWFVETYGFTHVGFTLMVIGYVISREMRRSKVHRLRQRWIPLVASFVAALAAATALTLLIYGLIQSALRVEGVAPVTFFVLMQIVVAGCLGVLALIVTVVTNTDLRYGAVSLGIGAMLLFTWTYDIASIGGDFDGWTLRHWLATTVVVGAILLVMWQVFGPGAAAAPRREEFQDDTDATASMPTRLNPNADG